MKHKSEAFEKFKEYKYEVEKQTKHSIITLRSDRGGEYLNGEFLDYLKENAPSLASPVLCTELEDNQKVRLLKDGQIKAGEALFAIDIYE